MSTVFISYSHADSEVASGISDILKQEGVSHFLDVKSIQVGDDIEDRVWDALHNCAVVVVIISSSSLESLWVPFEVGHGKALRKDILPFLVDPKLTLPLYLARLSH